MAKDPSRTESASGSAAEGSRESLPRLSEVFPLHLHCVLISLQVVPDFEELSPFYQRPSSAPAAGVDTTRPYSSTIGDPENQQQTDTPAETPQREPPLPPLRGSVVRTHRTSRCQIRD